MANVLKVKPKLWKEVGKRQIRIDVPIIDKKVPILKSEDVKQNYAPIPLNKVGEYYEEEDNNTNIPKEFEGLQMLAILDGGAQVATIATKKIW